MALFQRKPQESDPKGYYTFSNTTAGLPTNKTVLLVGLGNPGDEYINTRHNAGFTCIDSFVTKTDEMADWIKKKDLKCLMSTGQINNVRVVAIMPLTFMNLSGEAVQAAASFYKILPKDIVVIHDEIDIEFGQIRLRMGGSAAGHNGIKSVSQHIGEDYGRVRIGIGPKKPSRIKSEDFVLKSFADGEQSQIPNLTKEVNAILSEYVFGGQLPNETRSFIV